MIYPQTSMANNTDIIQYNVPELLEVWGIGNAGKDISVNAITQLENWFQSDQNHQACIVLINVGYVGI